MCDSNVRFCFPDGVDWFFSVYFAGFCSRSVAIGDVGTVVAFDRCDAKPLVLGKVLMASNTQRISLLEERTFSGRRREVMAQSEVRSYRRGQG